MSKCAVTCCQLDTVFLESQCWNHLKDYRKATYPDRLCDEMVRRRAVVAQNFRSVVLHGTVFPESLSFRECDFSQAELESCSLQRADLRGSDFTSARLKDCHLEYSDLRGTKTSLRNADVRESHLDGALLQNVDFTGADLRDAILVGADMIGAMLQGAHLYASRLVDTRLRKESLCNFRRTRRSKIAIADEKDRSSGEPTPLQARFVYTALKNNFRSVGEYEDERWAHIKERVMERKRLFRLVFQGDRTADALALEHWNPDEMTKLYESRSLAAAKWALSWIAWSLAYGESPLRMMLLSLLVVLGFGLRFVADGVTWIDAMYLSVVSFTTLGFIPNRILEGHNGDPAFWMWFGTEAFIGAVMTSFFVVTFGRRIIRG
ncbi:MAG: pentapeptide repeat-containing protein [Nitrospirota bacterium]